MERIDFHAHCVPLEYRNYCLQNDLAGRGHPDGMPAIPKWDAPSHVQMMKKLNITKSVLSMSSPGTNLTPGNVHEARTLTRNTNQSMAQVCDDHPEFFLFFASLPLPDVEGSLVEIDYALDHLGAVGFQILTNSHGIYPGDPRFIPVFDKLCERGATVFFHPTSCHLPHDNGDVERVTPVPGLPNPVMEFMFDSTRALSSLFLSGTVQRCPGITFLICHCGATFPPIAARIAEFSSLLTADGNAITEKEIKELLQTRFYIDLAGVPFPDQIHGMLRLVDPSRLLYGSDYPFTKEPLAASLAARLDGGLAKEFGTDVARRVLLENGRELLSKLQTR
ncbi:hypothetical protein N7492_000977 [Penicillium capsulatum]|uniref:6-methylsalicylate decarboxylase n=1 Tax=Penicillium capsulatum TaxID=69766 RepID=A0A9W9IWW1_9EURO|nr:hypothetical protein N7492_000977 [Penicillium capsulatum]KAJ6129964.1 hypothetical protein N7512_002744 [Penicillium capsulatum]